MPEYKPEFPVDLNPHQRKVFWNRRKVRAVKADKALNVSTEYRHGAKGRHQFTPPEYAYEQRLYSGENSLEMKEKTIRESKAKRNLEQKYQTKGKKSLLTSQPTKSKGGGKSAGGGGGKFGIINRALGGRSPWHHLKRLLE